MKCIGAQRTTPPYEIDNRKKTETNETKPTVKKNKRVKKQAFKISEKQ